MKFDQIIADLKNKVYYPVYFLSGEEPFYIDEISGYIEQHVLSDMEKEFNQSVLYGKDVNVETIISYVKRFPMMSNYQVVIIKEAQDINKIEELASYFEKPLKSTILVLCYKYKKLDKRKSFAKTVASKGVLFESAKLYDNQIPEWINHFLKQKNYSIAPKASILLAEYLGNDLNKIVNELNKIMLNIPPTVQVTPDHVEEFTGISKDFNVFELQNAVGKKDILKANQIINYFNSNPKVHSLAVTLNILHSFFTKVFIYHQLPDKSKNNAASALSVNPFFVNDYKIAANNYSISKLIQIFSIIREYDLKFKGIDNISITENGLHKELIYKILH